MKKIAAILFFFLLAGAVFSQQRTVDSLVAVIKGMPGDSAKVNRLNELVSKMQYLDPVAAARTASQSMDLAEKINYPLGLATACRLYGVLYVDRMVLDSGKIYYDRAYSIVKDNKEKSFQRQAGLVTHNYGAIFHKKQLYDSAARKYTEAIKIFTACGEDGLSFFPFTNLSTIYSFLKDNRKALEYAKGAYAAATKLKDRTKIASAVNSEMSCRLDMGQYDSVLIPLRQNLSSAIEMQNSYQEGIICNLLGLFSIFC
jgi:tetratricopeptide (TPR) repeat protein